ncbi:ABC-2 family transporter protein [Paenibacillus uliginis N3/975]|uniref:ABC-2 family transporter protein n=1 Tax=Paenibacillus uliginis N3/975 TaxID=1313296 RepID=A0A1X7HQV9_9BACL|nr:ABC transporter permease [Paenibacillus uliginis]SMF91342.1 ABC-2 family transporter protein [Paenibacillus uliginis N3/975]
MLKLMKLELKKHKMGWYWKGALIASFLIIVLIGLISYVEEQDLKEAFSTFDEMFTAMSVMVRVVFVIFAAVLIGKLIINEYNNKTISIMFTYPVPRKKLIAAKLLLIMGITFITILISNVTVIAVFIALNSVLHIIPGTPSMELLINEGIQMLIQGLSAAGISMIPLYFGMRKKSVAATIVSSFILITLLNNNGGFYISSFIVIPITLGIIGLLIAYMSFRNVENVDVV